MKQVNFIFFLFVYFGGKFSFHCVALLHRSKNESRNIVNAVLHIYSSPHPQAPSPVQTEISTPPNSLVPGLDVGDLTQSSYCEDDEMSMADEGGYTCKCRKIVSTGHGM